MNRRPAASWRRLVGLVAAVAFVATACGGGSSGSPTAAPASEADAAPTDAPVSEPTATTEPAPTATPEAAPTAAPAPTPEPTATPNPDRDGDGVDNETDDFPDDPTRVAAIRSTHPVIDGVMQIDESLLASQTLRDFQQMMQADEFDPAGFIERLGPGFPSDSEVATFLEATKADFGNNWDILDVRYLYEWTGSVLVGDPSTPTGPASIVTVDLDPNVPATITGFRIFNWGRGLAASQYGYDRGTSTSQVLAAVDEFEAGMISALVAEVTDDGCRVIDGLRPDMVLNTASVYKTWVLGAAAVGIADGTISLDETLTYAPGTFMNLGARTTAQFTSPVELSLQTSADLMMGQSDNGATDLVERRVGREAMWAFVDRSGHTDPTVMNPIIGVRDYDHLFASVPASQVDAFVNGSEQEQQRILTDVLEPLGPNRQGSFGNANVLDYTWKASPIDICETMATMRRDHVPGSPAADFIDQAFGADANLFGQRTQWDRVWTKGGGIPAFTQGENIVWTLATMAESNEHGAYAVIVMFNDTEGFPVDQLPFSVQSWMARLYENIIAER